ncbi:DUF1292 domain-containing protein [Bacillus sp. AGMB 02131]|uniref:UPF0473 protein IEO70_14500 n=1 Tax=Peribacillus faecalis TaxID=2772559 RepID=A0A927D0Z7_9BACI|nr:DUF1292 domain-containing protein [Peribacillus faecalis]MBD3109555.1 DUF1292 domain-containing protein [Peribacillus faecalis]
MNEQQITIIDENGNEQLCEILFFFHSDEFNKDYVLYYPIGEEDENGEIIVHASSYVQNDEDTEGELAPIETEEEWDLVEEMYNTFVEEQESDEE